MKEVHWIVNAKALVNTDTWYGRLINQLIFPVIIAVIVLIMNLITRGRMLSGNGLYQIFVSSILNAIIGMAISYTWSTGPDFAVAAAYILAANVGIIATMKLGLGYFGLFGGSILTCVVLQLISTWLRIKLKLPSWVLGMAICLIYEAFGVMYSLWCTKQTVGGALIQLGPTDCKGIVKFPADFLLWLGVIIVLMLIQNKTTFGLNYRAVSSNMEVAEHMGINSRKTIYLGVTIGAALMGIAGAFNAASANLVNTTSNLGSFGQIARGLAAWLLSSGMRRMDPVLSIALSSFAISALFVFLTYLGVPQGTWMSFFLGMFIVVFLCLATRSNKKEE